MRRYSGGATVPGGYYLESRTFQVTPVPGECGQLPGPDCARYVRVSLPLLFVAAPLIGAAYVVALPMIGVGLAAHAAARRLGQATARHARDLASTLAPAWRPGEAPFADKPRADAEKPEQVPPAPAKLDALEKEIGERRAEETRK